MRYDINDVNESLFNNKHFKAIKKSGSSIIDLNPLILMRKKENDFLETLLLSNTGGSYDVLRSMMNLYSVLNGTFDSFNNFLITNITEYYVTLNKVLGKEASIFIDSNIEVEELNSLVLLAIYINIYK